MWALLLSTLGIAAGSFVAKALTGAGLALVGFVGLSVGVNMMLATVDGLASGLPAGLIAIIRISGVGDGLSLVGSAMLTRAWMASAQLGLKKAAS